MNLVIIYGTRPEYLKLLPLIQRLNCKTIRILQHTDIIEDISCYKSVSIENTDTSRLDSLGSQILEKLGPLLGEFTHVLVQGDTATTFYSALCAFQNNKKIIHLEAGLRTYDISKPYPEEAYRQMVSRMADVHLCPHQINADILKQEKVQGTIHVVGNTILDLVKSYNLTTTKGNTVLITYHRRENIKYLDFFIQQVKNLINSQTDKKFIWVMHPNKELQKHIENSVPNCTFIQPCSHRDFLEYVKNCYCVLTDSGGIQEECAFLGKPTIVLRQTTERDQIKEPYLFIVPPPYDSLNNIFNLLPAKDLTPCLVYGDGYSTKNIVNMLDPNFPQFNAGWSYTQKEMNELFKHIDYKDNYSVLEFGSGDSTIKLYNYLKTKVDNLTFYTYESDCNFVIPGSNVKYVTYDLNNIGSLELPDIKFDLILIDGPTGELRSKWYSKIRNNVKQGTILLIDDFNHYKSFSTELDKNFKYEVLSFSDEPFVPYGEHSWKIVSIQRPI